MCYHGDCHIVNVAAKSNLAHFQLYASQLAQGELNPWEPLHELLIQLLLQVTWLHILDDACDVGGEREEGAVLASPQPSIKSVRVIRLCQGLGGGCHDMLH